MSPSRRTRSHERPARSRALALLLCIAAAVSLAYAFVPRGVSAARAPQSDAAYESAGEPRQSAPFVPGEVLVRFRGQSKVLGADASVSALTASDGREIPVRMETPRGFEVVRGLRLARVAAGDEGAAIESLRARPDVVYAEPNYLRRKFNTPNDPRFTEQWGLKNTGQVGSEGYTGTPGADIDAEAAWNTTTGSSQVVVGVIDEGIDINHPDLQANIWTNPGEVAGNGLDDDGDGFIDDVHGWDFYHDDASVYDNPSNVSGLDAPDAHGTHVAGIIGAAGNNGQGVTGVNWNVRILPMKILGEGAPSGGSVLETVRAYGYAKTLRDLYVSSGGTKGANLRVVNNSYGGESKSRAELDAILALNDSGVLFVAAAGNSFMPNDQYPVYPASYDAPNVVTVAATERRDMLSSFSNFGERSVHLGAPGSGVLSTTPNGTYSLADGTSMAAPHVSGVAALVWAAHPEFTVARVRAALLFGGDEVGNLVGVTQTGRRVSAAGSLANAAEADTTPPAVNDLKVGSQTGRAVSLQWTAPGDDGAGGGRASLYEVRFKADSGEQYVLATRRPLDPGAAESMTVNVPFRRAAGTIILRALDDVGNVGTASVAVAVAEATANPYLMTTEAHEQLSTGGTQLGITNDTFLGSVNGFNLPFKLPFFERYVQTVAVTSNGVIFFPRGPRDTFGGDPEWLSGATTIAPMWEALDMRTSRRADSGVFVVQPDADRVIFRWQAVTLDVPLGDGTTRGEHPVNFEVELRRDGTVVTRYGDGNTRLMPVVGIGGGEPEPYLVDSHTSQGAFKDLTNAPNVRFTLRQLPKAADLKLSISDSPDPILLNQTITYRTTVTNAGPDPATGVKVTNELPIAFQFLSCASSQGSCRATTLSPVASVTAEPGTLAPGASATLTVTVKAGAVNSSSTARATAAAFTYDPDESTNTASCSTTMVFPNPSAATGVLDIAAGGGHSLGLVADGVLAWGDNTSGQLGDGTNKDSRTPVWTRDLFGVVAFGAGNAHSMALKSDGTVWAWGGNYRGQLGDGTTNNRNAPAQVAGLNGVKALAGGQNFSVALRTDGTLRAWGDNAYGQLGDGTTSDRLTPVQVQGIVDVAAVAAGTDFTVALRNDGTVWTWGHNQSGQLGDGTTSQRSLPAQVAGLSGVKAVAAGYDNAYALKTDGTVWAWGNNWAGQVGDGTTTLRRTPVQVVGLAGVQSIAAGFNHCLALRADGTVWSWGNDGSGQVGDGFLEPFADHRTAPVQVALLAGVTKIAAGGNQSLALQGGKVYLFGQNNITTSYPYEMYAPVPRPRAKAPTFSPDGGTFATAQPVVVGDGEGTRQIATFATGSTMLAAMTDGTVWGWGDNSNGQLGYAPNNTAGAANYTASPVQVGGLSNVAAVATGTSYGVALRSDGTVWSWGSNSSGVLGDGTTSSRTTPVQAVGLTGVTAIAASAHTLAVRNDGTVWAWGDNTYGQLGDGTTNARSVPTQVPGLTGVVAVAAGAFHSVAVKSDGTVWAWGDNRWSLGNGTTGLSQPTPVRVNSLSNARAAAAGFGFTLVLKNDGTVWAWGRNESGEIGSNNSNVTTPAQIAGLADVVALDRCVALKSDGTVWAWGANLSGQLGDGTTGVGRATPGQVPGLSGVKTVEGFGSRAALKTDGTLWVWGSNQYYQLGSSTIFQMTSPAQFNGFGNSAEIHYTTNGADPTQADPVVAPGASVMVSTNAVLKARAFKSGYSPSDVKSATFVINSTPQNPIDDSGYYVAQHYRDFLGREPDADGLRFWTQGIDSCGPDLQCRQVKRIDTSAAFFLSIEFRETGYLVYRTYKAAYGNLPGKPVPVTLSDFTADAKLLDDGLVVNAPGWQTVLETNKRNYFNAFVERDRFKALYPASLTAAQFVAALNANAGQVLAETESAAFAAGLADGKLTRADVLRVVAEDADLQRQEFNRAFVLMQYFGYLRRDPDGAPDADFTGYQFWLGKLDEFRGNYIAAEMVKAFLDSIEYRKRFGQP